jgi:FAD/FMN-containing dehydrogenase
MAARVGAGLETWEAHNKMALHNMTLIVPLTNTVGPYGGFTSGGGHSTFASYHGLGSDQVLSINAVTADGNSVTADPTTNTDLFYAMRGGGGSKSFVIFPNPTRRF